MNSQSWGNKKQVTWNLFERTTELRSHTAILLFIRSCEILAHIFLIPCRQNLMNSEVIQIQLLSNSLTEKNAQDRGFWKHFHQYLQFVGLALWASSSLIPFPLEMCKLSEKIGTWQSIVFIGLLKLWQVRAVLCLSLKINLIALHCSKLISIIFRTQINSLRNKTGENTRTRKTSYGLHFKWEVHSVGKSNAWFLISLLYLNTIILCLVHNKGTLTTFSLLNFKFLAKESSLL